MGEITWHTSHSPQSRKERRVSAEFHHNLSDTWRSQRLCGEHNVAVYIRSDLGNTRVRGESTQQAATLESTLEQGFDFLSNILIRIACPCDIGFDIERRP